MTGILIFGGTILLLVLALEPAERRLRKRAPQPWTEEPVDRDAQRMREELRALTQSQSASAAWPVPTHRLHSTA